MELSDKDVRSRLLPVFASHRQSPQAPFDEDRFLDYLIEPPADLEQIKDSVASNLRFVRFIDAVQAEFVVHFSQKDRETRFTLERFIERIQKLRSNPTGSLLSLGNARSSFDINVVIIANALVLAAAWFSHHSRWLFAAIIVAWIAMNGWMFWFYRREKQHLDSLEKEILRLRKEGRRARR